MTYKKKSGDKGITIAANGKVTLAKGMSKGTHKAVMTVTIPKKGNYVAVSKDVTISVLVK